MKNNRTLAISCSLKDFKKKNTLGFLENVFPTSIFDSVKDGDKKKRNRIFTPEKTLMTMVSTAVQEDKSLKNSVMLSQILHQKERQYYVKESKKQLEKQKRTDQGLETKPGRPKKYEVNLPKSLRNDTSLNTAAYSKARSRLSLELTEALFNESRIKESSNCYTHWYGYRVLIGDGTYLQMQDTKDIRKEYEVKHNEVGSDCYPQGLLEVIIERGTGQIHSFRLDNRHVSELSMFYKMIDDLPKGSLLLLDDLYNCYEIISKCKRKGVELLIPCKRERNHKVVEVIGDGDEIVEIKTPKSRSKWLDKNEEPGTFLLRRITCKSPEGKKYVMMTTILDKEIPREDIQLLYLTRWDIEVGIREVKTIMDINILRSKTPEMALKELTVVLATYNLIRKIIYASIKDLPFSPKSNFIYQFYTSDKNVFVDKKGRVYKRWSTGRKRNPEVTT